MTLCTGWTDELMTIVTDYIGLRCISLVETEKNNLNRLEHDSVEIPTRFSFVIEFIIPKFIEGSTCFERHTAHHQEL